MRNLLDLARQHHHWIGPAVAGGVFARFMWNTNPTDPWLWVVFCSALGINAGVFEYLAKRASTV